MTRRLAFAATLTLTLGALAAEPQKAPPSLLVGHLSRNQA